VPEDRRADAIADLEHELAPLLDNLPVKPAQAGEMILFGEGAEETLRQLWRNALEEVRDEESGEPPATRRA
jgi:hypothetical protein